MENFGSRRDRDAVSYGEANSLDDLPRQAQGHRRDRRLLRAAAFGLLLAGALAVFGAVRPADACTDGETRPCEPQAGVCLDRTQTCSGGEWQPCDAPGYQSLETFCDGLDNDCDGLVDIVDQDGDGANACRIPGVENELLLTDIGDPGAITIFEYRDGSYEEAWKTITSDVEQGISGGGEAGDLDGDGILDIAIARHTSAGSSLEVWSFDPQSGGWAEAWASSPSAHPYRVGEIADFDNDGVNELLVTNEGENTLELYSWDGDTYSKEATLRDCPERGAFFIPGAGDLDGDGTPEILFQCYTPEDIIIQEFDGSAYPVVARVTPPLRENGNLMIIDDMETGDVNGDGRDDAVFCGNSGAAHVLTFQNGTYSVEYSSPNPILDDAFSQACSVGDVTDDGIADILVVNKEGAKIYQYLGTAYEEIWVGEYPYTITAFGGLPPIGGSFIGDADNDGINEFLFVDNTDYPPEELPSDVKLYDHELGSSDRYVLTQSFVPLEAGPTILIANLNPLNDPSPADCDDNDPTRGSGEHCGPDYSRPAAGSGGGINGSRWSDEFTICNTGAEDRDVLFTFTERGAPGQPVHSHAETLGTGTCDTYDDPVQDWFGREMYGALLIDAMDGPAEDIKVSGFFKNTLEGRVTGQSLGNVPLEEAVTGDAYIFTTLDPERDRIGTGFQATRDGTSLELTLENPIGTVHWRKEFGDSWAHGENMLLSRVEEKAPGVSNLIIHYTVLSGAAVLIGTVTDNQSGDPAARLPAVPSDYLVLPVIGKTAGRGVDWMSEFAIANATQTENTARLNLYLGGTPLTAELQLGPGEPLAFSDLVSQVTWHDAAGNAVLVDDAVGALEIIADGNVIAGSKFNSRNPENGELLGLSLRAMSEPNVTPGNEYRFLGVKNEDPSGVSRANVIVSNLSAEDATLSVDVLRPDGTLAGSYEMTAPAGRYTNTRVPKSITQPDVNYTLSMTSTQPVYAVTTNVNASNDAYSIYPINLQKLTPEDRHRSDDPFL